VPHGYIHAALKRHKAHLHVHHGLIISLLASHF